MNSILLFKKLMTKRRKRLSFGNDSLIPKTLRGRFSPWRSIEPLLAEGQPAGSRVASLLTGRVSLYGLYGFRLRIQARE